MKRSDSNPCGKVALRRKSAQLPTYPPPKGGGKSHGCVPAALRSLGAGCIKLGQAAAAPGFPQFSFKNRIN